MSGMCDSAKTIDCEAFDGQLGRIVAAIGLHDAERLLQKRGGTRLQIADGRTDIAWLDEFLGIEQAETLRRAFPEALWLDLPTSKKIEAERRNTSIRNARARGMSVNELACSHGLTASYVRMILSTRNEG